MTHYTQRADEWFRVSPAHKIGCCDCGLVHLLEFRIVDGEIEMRALRDERATAAKRAHRRKRNAANPP